MKRAAKGLADDGLVKIDGLHARVREGEALEALARLGVQPTVLRLLRWKAAARGMTVGADRSVLGTAF